MHAVHPTAGEWFYHRMLLTIVKGATDWRDLHTFNEVEYPTYKDACLAQGLLKDDCEWHQCLVEAGEPQSGHQLCLLFSIILRLYQPTRPEKLWQDYRDQICDDLHR
jgi:hypothetical protein